jgi:hypothetical protein
MDESAVCSPDGPTPEEAREAERQRVIAYDKPLEDDPIGNGIIGAIGGGVAGLARGGLGMAARMASSGSGWLTKTAKYLLDGSGDSQPHSVPQVDGPEAGTY